MKTKFATFSVLFFLILSSSAEEATIVHKYAGRADGFYRRTLSRIAEGWVGSRENFRFAVQSLKDKAVTAEREAKARAKLTYDSVRNDAVRKTGEIASDAYGRVAETGEKIRDDVVGQVRKTGSDVGKEVKDRAKQGVRDVKNADW